MNKSYSNNHFITSVYKKMFFKSEVTTQMVYGESFSIIKSYKNWLKIRIDNDKYIGFVKKKKYNKFIKPSHKIASLFANIYKYPNLKKKIGELPYGSKIKVSENYSKFIKFDNKWIEKKNIKNIEFKNKNIFSNIAIFKNTKYKWGGKTFKGIDCSALIQVFFNFNNKYCPRDTKDQVKFFKKNINLRNIRKNDIIYWKGHVALAISKKMLIHAYGPEKKTLIMNIAQTIKKIKNTANLEIISIKRI